MPDRYDLEDSIPSRIAAGVRRLDAWFIGRPVGGIELVGLSLRAPTRENPEYLVTLRGLDADGQPLVAFHSAMTLGDALAGAVNRQLNGGLKWKPDKWGR